MCVACGAPVSGRIDSYAATAFAPIMPPPSPANVKVRDVATAPTSHAIPAMPADMGSGPTMMSAQAPPEITMPVQQQPASPIHPPTMRSHQVSPSSPPPGPQYVVTPTPPPQPSPYYPGAQSSGQMPPSPYAPPPMPGMYPMGPVMAPGSMQQRTSASGLSIAALICGIFGLTPFWIGFLLCILAIIFGAIVLSQTRAGDAGRGMAIAGLILGLCFVLPAACGL